MKNLLIIACALQVSAAFAYEVTPQTKIVIPDMDETGIVRAIRSAATEFSRDIEEATGWKLKVVEAAKAGDTAGAILIGEPFAREAGLAPKNLRSFDNVIAEKGGRLYLFGHDRTGHNPGGKPLDWDKCILPSVKAVTEFEYHFMGVRYLQPGRVGIAVPKREKIAVPDGTLKINRPHMEAGNGRLFSMMYSIANNILGSGSYKTHSGHLYPVAFPVEKYFKDHPEYYGLVGDDRAQSQPGNPVLCISNPDVKRIIVDYMVKLFDEGWETIELGQNDGGDFCQCEKCRAYGGPGAKTAGEKFWIFHRSIAEDLYRLRPEKTVQIIMYGLTRELPKTFADFPPNVMIEMMGYGPKVFADWKRYKVARGFSVYTYMWGEYPLPGLTCKVNCEQLAGIARRFVREGVKTIYRCGYGELFGTEGPASYVFNQLLAAPERDVAELTEEYIAAAYGPATRHMRKFHKLLDDRLAAWTHCYWLGGGDGEFWSSDPMDGLAYIYTPAAINSLAGYLAAAEATPGLSAKEKKRLELVRREFDYARITGEICHLYNAFKLHGTKAYFDPLADKILARNAMVDAMYDEKGRKRRLEGWPDVTPLGSFDKSTMLHNGRLNATLQAPFTWNIELMRKNNVIPGGPKKETKVARKLADAPWNPIAGMQFDKCDYKTRFRCAYDSENFYVEVDAELPDDQKFTAQGHDGVCFRQECLELYIDPTFEKAKSFHFIWNPVEDSYFEAAYGLCLDPLDPLFDQFNVTWNGKWSYTTSRKDGRWTSVATIPFASLGARVPGKGEKWYLNLGRETYKPGDQQIQLWNPSMEGRGMSDLDAMGIVTFE